jgi:hypothetical protein
MPCPATSLGYDQQLGNVGSQGRCWLRPLHMLGDTSPFRVQATVSTT